MREECECDERCDGCSTSEQADIKSLISALESVKQKTELLGRINFADITGEAAKKKETEERKVLKLSDSKIMLEILGHIIAQHNLLFGNLPSEDGDAFAREVNRIHLKILALF